MHKWTWFFTRRSETKEVDGDDEADVMQSMHSIPKCGDRWKNEADRVT